MSDEALKRQQDQLRLADKVGRICSSDIPGDKLWMLFHAVVSAAARYWEGIDPDDFCLQYFGDGHIVFGGTNRLIYSPGRGFYPDKSYCSDKFLKHYEELGRNPNALS